jgi:hypothetical protein
VRKAKGGGQCRPRQGRQLHHEEKEVSSSTENTRLVTDPRDIPRTRRRDGIRNITSMRAGVIAPIGRFVMLRGDSLKAQVRIAAEMLETREILMNPVHLRITWYLMPWSAMERFQGSMDQFNRSYKGQPQVNGGDVVPFFETHAYGTLGSNAVYRSLGFHATPTFQAVTMDLETYNAVINFRRENRSPDLPKRDRLQTDLAEAFWEHPQFRHVVPHFDNDLVSGEVALNVVEAKMPISGLGVAPSASFGGTDGMVKDGMSPDPAGTNYPHYTRSDVSEIYVRGNGAGPGFGPDIYAELQQNGITVSLADINTAEMAQKFAKIRTRYKGHEEWVKDMMMDGLEIPDLALTQPILLSKQTVQVTQVKRFATDGANLTDSAVSGGMAASFTLRVPRLPVGGIVMCFAEAMPEQMWERQSDPLFHLKATADAMGVTNLAEALPEVTRDQLDPEKVEIVFNRDVDTSHSNPGGTFGYSPLHARWDGVRTRAGGKFLRPAVDAGTDDARQRFWASEDIDPSLGESFYLVKNLHQKPFIENDVGFEPFEVTIQGMAVLTGTTQFGPMLIEASDDYEKVMAKAPTERIEQE